MLLRIDLWPVGVAAAVVGLQGPGHVVHAARLPHRPGRRVGQPGWQFKRNCISKKKQLKYQLSWEVENGDFYELLII